MPKLLFITNGAVNFLSHRLDLALKAIEQGYEVHAALPLQKADQIKKLKALNIIVHSLPLKRSSVNPFREIATIFCITKLLFKLKPDVLHLIALKAILYGNIALKLVRIQATVNLFTGMGFLFTHNRPKVYLARRVVLFFLHFTIYFNKNSITVVQNDDDAELLLKEKVVKKSYLTVIRGSGVDINYFKYLPEPSSDLVVILPSRLLLDKGVEEFVEASKKLGQLFPHVSFVLVGDVDPGNRASMSRKKVESWVSEGVVQHWGWCRDMREVFSRSHIVCLPSYREGVPKVLLEAASCGRVIVTTDAPGCKDVVKNGETGLLVPVKSVDALVEAISLLLKSKSMRINMAKCARKYVEENFSSEKIVAETLGIYNQLLSTCKDCL